MIGRYLDALAAEGEWAAIDRVITAQLWTTHRTINAHHESCLVGHAGDFVWKPEFGATQRRGGVRPYELASDYGLVQVENRFDLAVKRFGMDRVVRAIKARCGSHTRPNIEAPVTSESAVTHA